MICGGSNITTAVHDPKVKAFLDLIARAEGTYGRGDNGYNILYSYQTFSDYSRHPNRAITSGGITSTAAGRYQFLKKTWDSVQSSLNLSNFNPASQDLGAVELIRRRGALNDILNGNIQSAITKVNKEWASFPGSPYGQGTRSMSEMLSWYNSDLQKYSGSGNNEIISPAYGATKIAEELGVNEAGFGSTGIAAAVGIALIAGIVIYNNT